ncbi:MAG TPA: symmetrical bis(5'-nucleosyl)-tetraphosphatase [Ramlibacter sp.]|jgi:bis(5'-nucleosyl)-tetraphosphatase (symmetrical)|uniref:symmetrical bis(5'-nucleosyl)-tetraphosphatase n=1 Tax=Ramlibacter sp. TaxID=1917967 RepID=UPI002D31D631|nr:symmetrical bis(5'-nucleosyl)-tetraphosphatase [Ramlibacter sp.]HZY19034.1 symmetrical bis(5'-nucleosyl)-tetraphosphatase [Ramlibacter sp.]
MALYLIGDVQGCDGALGRLLEKVGFSASRDHAVLLGDLVNRGPASAAVLRRAMALGGSATCLLGNHDLSLLAVAHGVRAAHRNDTLASVLQAPDRQVLLDWLRHRPLAVHAHGLLMVHGGVLPQWDVPQVLRLAAEVEAVLRGPEPASFLRQMYGNEPARWSDALQGADRLRAIVNALTRLRFCTVDGAMDLKAGGAPAAAPAGTVAWFDVPGRASAGTPIAFGHWSQLGLLLRPDVIALDTGCVWGGCLSALRYDPVTGSREVIQVACEQAQAPGE